MRILDKYIIKSFLPPFFYCLLLFIFLYIIIDLFGHLDEILKQGVGILILQEYYLSMIPFIIMHTTPIASLISTIYVITAMNKYDEITAMRAAGINIFRILMPFIYIGLAITILIFLVSEKLLPVSTKNTEIIKKNYIEKRGRDITKPREMDTISRGKNKEIINNIALYGKNDRLIFIKSYDRYNNTVKGVTILEQDKNSNVIAKTNAEEGKWLGDGWMFSNILIYRLDEKGMVAGGPLFFENKSLDMEGPKDLISKGTSYELMSFKDLSNYIRNFSNTSPDIVQRLRVDLHQKISFPFTSLVAILIGASFAIKIKRKGKAVAIMEIGMSLVIGFIYYALMATFIALGKGGILPPLLSAHLANLLFLCIGVLLIKN